MGEVKRVDFKGGSFYEGHLNGDGQPHGRGVYQWSNGDKYNGEWHSGKQHGQGVCSYGSGNIYDGNWHDGKKRRKGKI